MKGTKILVVEDNSKARRFLAQTLEKAGYAVVTAGNGREAFEYTAQEPFDAVLLDLHLPYLTGLEVLRQLRLTGVGVPVVMMSGETSLGNAVEALKLGVVDFLAKPFAPEDLRRLLAEVLTRQSVAADRLDDYPTCLRYAKARLMQSDWGCARAALQKALSFDPWQPEPYNLLGMVAELSEDPLQGSKMYRAALALEATYGPARENLARMAGLSGQRSRENDCVPTP